MEKNILKMEGVSYYYPAKTGNVEILSNADYAFDTGKLYAIMGPSGSGKTTTLSLLGALDDVKQGRILFRGEDIRKIGKQYRSRNVGIIFQAYNLFPYLNARENVEVSLEISGQKKGKTEVAVKLLERMGLDATKQRRKIDQLSGGEQQRVAIARTLAAQAVILLADEPTGNLDEESAARMQDIFCEVAHELDKCVIVVTHSESFASKADVVLHLKEKKLVKIKGA